MAQIYAPHGSILAPARRLALALALLLALSTGGRAQEGPVVFTVSGIVVDASASDAVSARREALDQGQRAGLDRLLRRLVPVEEHERLPPAASLPVEGYVRNFSIGEEEVSATRYMAELTVAYEADAVRDLLGSLGVPFAEIRSAPLVVLPIYQGPEEAVLWPDGNPWWQAWSENLDDERLVRLILPLGDLEDMSRVNLAQARAGDTEALAELAARYGSQDVLIVTARANPDDDTPVVRVEARRLGEVERVGEPITLQARPGQSREELFAEAITRLQDSLDERWKSANLLRFDHTGLMVVDIPIDELRDWVRISQGLIDLPEVSQVDIDTFARDEVRAQIRYIGDEFRLEEAFLRLGLRLAREGETWQLLPMGGRPAPDVPASATSATFSPAPQ